MKKRRLMAMLLAGAMALGSSAAVGAEEAAAPAEATEAPAAEAAAPAETTEAPAADAAAPAEAAEAPAATLGEDIYGFQMMMEGVLYQLPMTYAELTANGWTLSTREDPEMMLGSNEYAMVYFTKGEYEICADMLNLSVNECKVTDCLVAGISVDTEYEDYDVAAFGVTLPKGITVGASTLEDIKAAYGEPSDTYEGDLGSTLTYEIDYNQSVEFYVSKEKGYLVEVDVRNFTEPEGFDKGGVSTETPEIVTAYQAPTALSENMMDPVVEFCGDLYQLPCPVTALQANGWELLDVTEESFVAGDDIAFLDLMRDNQTISLTAYNLTPNAVLPENCFVTEMQGATYDENITLTLSGNITLGMEKDALIARAGEMGFTYEEDEDYLTIYADPQDEYSRYIEVWFNKDENPTAAASVTYRSELLEQ